jgi:hypothetical protein
VDVVEGRQKLKAVVQESKSFRDLVKHGAENGNLDDVTLMQLTKILEALQEHFLEAGMQLDWDTTDLIDERRPRWW